MSLKKSELLAIALRENLQKRKIQKRNFGEKSDQLRQKKIGSSSILNKEINVSKVKKV